jgi:uncharacterized protein (DUF885 family)
MRQLIPFVLALNLHAASPTNGFLKTVDQLLDQKEKVAEAKRMHALGWSRQLAIDYFKTNAGKTEHDIILEVDRYIVWPGQALAYKMGELKIKLLRARAENMLADKFDIRGFHDELLRRGAIPLSILETQVDAWIARQAAK